MADVVHDIGHLLDLGDGIANLQIAVQRLEFLHRVNDTRLNSDIERGKRAARPVDDQLFVVTKHQLHCVGQLFGVVGLRL